MQSKAWSKMAKSIIVDFTAARQHSSNPAPGSTHCSANRSEQTRLLFADHATETSESRKQHIADQIVETNIGVAMSIVHRHRDRGEHVASLGLVKAVNGFDSSRGVDFLVYAVPTIAGEVKRRFRDRCWVVRPTRRIQELKSHLTGCTEMRRHPVLAGSVYRQVGRRGSANRRPSIHRPVDTGTDCPGSRRLPAANFAPA